jgi:hypothetical protein
VRACALVLVLFACGEPHTARPISERAAPSTASDFTLEYASFALMPAPKCGSPVYRISIARDRTFACGWTSACPPYSEAAPLRPKPAGTLAASQIDRLTALVQAPAFAALPTFSSNPHIIDGGEQRFVVHAGAVDKSVEMANTSAPPFDALRDALEAATGCSIRTAGPEPQ